LRSRIVVAAHANGYNIVFVVTAGLSARAVQLHGQPVLASVLPAFPVENWRIAPIVIMRHARGRRCCRRRAEGQLAVIPIPKIRSLDEISLRELGQGAEVTY